MAPAAPFNPPSSNLPSKPFVPEWVPPPATKEKHNFAKLKSIDLSLLDSDDPAVVDNLIELVKVAIRDDGFLFLENYGVSLEQVRDSKNNIKISVTDHVSLAFSIAPPSIFSRTISIQKH